MLLAASLLSTLPSSSEQSLLVQLLELRTSSPFALYGLLLVLQLEATSQLIVLFSLSSSHRVISGCSSHCLPGGTLDSLSCLFFHGSSSQTLLAAARRDAADRITWDGKSFTPGHF